MRSMLSSQRIELQLNQPPPESTDMKHLHCLLARLRSDDRGSVFVEYLLLLTIVGIGVIVGLSSVRLALIDELQELASAIDAITI